MAHTSATLVLNESVCRANIKRMVLKAHHLGLQFRPHFKTHQSAKAGEWFREEGVDQCTVSSVEMASYFYRHGWSDICLSTPANPLQKDILLKLAGSARLSITLCDPETAEAFGHDLKYFESIYIKVDTAYGRAGIVWEQIQPIGALISQITAMNGKVGGFLAHEGHTYSCRSAKEVEQIRKSGNERMQFLKLHFPGMIASVGDTPSCSLSKNFKGIDEIRPGNFVFYDLMQWNIGSCSYEDIALRMLAPVVSRAATNHAILHCGSAHLSKESLNIPGVGTVYGKVFVPSVLGYEQENAGWISGLSQEHAILSGSPQFISQMKPGTMAEIIPVHSCLAVSAMRSYFLTSGKKVKVMNEQQEAKFLRMI